MTTDKFKALKQGDWVEFYRNITPKCPHCGEEYDIHGNDTYHLYDESERHEVECPSCEQEFTVISSANWSFSTDEQEGLNNDD